MHVSVDPWAVEIMRINSTTICSAESKSGAAYRWVDTATNITVRDGPVLDLCALEPARRYTEQRHDIAREAITLKCIATQGQIERSAVFILNSTLLEDVATTCFADATTDTMQSMNNSKLLAPNVALNSV